jgi:signal transduction histidine kinase
MASWRAARWWTDWLSDSPGETAAAPGRIEARYRKVAGSIRRHPMVVDSVLAAVLAAVTVPQLVYWARQPAGGFPERLAFSVLLVAPLIWRRRFPLSTFAFAAAVALVQWNANVTLAADVVLLVYLYTVASRYPARVGILAAVVVEVGVLLAAFRWNLAGDLAQPWPQRIFFLSGPVAVALLLGVSVRGRRQSMAALTERAERLERERDQQAMIAVAAERTRIAREMHDVVAHSLSVMVTLSDAAALKQATEPERAVMAMRQVSTTGHQALDEMRRLLGVLRTDDGSEGRQPQPGIVQIDELIDQVRATGLIGRFTITGTPAAMPLGAELTVYRIVQEAITNTLKHADDPTRIDVAVSFLPDEVTVDVHDDGAHRTRPEVTRGGLGLTGMRERAAVYGGTVVAGPDSAGGWCVHARLPLATMSPASRVRKGDVR